MPHGSSCINVVYARPVFVCLQIILINIAIVFILLDLKSLRPMPHFQDAINYLLEEFPKMVRSYVTDPGYQLATVLNPHFGPSWFSDFGGSKFCFHLSSNKIMKLYQRL